MAEVFFIDEQDAAPVDSERLRCLVALVLESERVADEAEVCVTAVDLDTMAGLNKRYLRQDAPTDVLAFPIEDDPTKWKICQDGDGCPILLGDVVICPEVVRDRAELYEGLYEAGLDLLVVHGILHLLGYDHIQEEDAVTMEQREQDLLEAFCQGRTQ